MYLSTWRLLFPCLSALCTAYQAACPSLAQAIAPPASAKPRGAPFTVSPNQTPLGAGGEERLPAGSNGAEGSGSLLPKLRPVIGSGRLLSLGGGGAFLGIGLGIRRCQNVENGECKQRAP
ncbi:hypothetical protein QBC34DRAFT_145174 [Podospora aff. communis PSN243]|uniref:Uncharacterized protein n=1 Tax=Podospora aff. communis PSN243 TaxID=3040156 RepID=A0AAV9GGI0_9PEZI|nr:hypothetical protein QBC34DRAFT_145174 [Podospora aff. communis PSN243]